MKIGVFDSGLGGLAVFSGIARCLPQHDLVYLGDNARMPYGNRSQDVIFDFTRQAVRYLFEYQNCALVILACNTASAEALRKLQQEFLPQAFPDRKILGVIRPTVEEISRMSAKHVLVLATRSTVDSCAYVRELSQISPDTKITQQAAPLLVPMIEEGWVGTPEMKRMIKKYLEEAGAGSFDVLVPACTHYSLLVDEFAALLPDSVSILDTPQLVAEALQDYLQRHREMGARLETSGMRRYLVTDLKPHYQEMARKILGRDVEFSKVTLPNF